jgi:hypothetical protein
MGAQSSITIITISQLLQNKKATILPQLPTNWTTMMPFKIAVLLLCLVVALHSTSAFVNNNNHNADRRRRPHRRGARGEMMISPRTSPEMASSPVALHMAPPKKKKAAAAADTAAETLRKKDVVAAISEQLDMTKADAEAAVTAVFDVISDVSWWRCDENILLPSFVLRPIIWMSSRLMFMHFLLALYRSSSKGTGSMWLDLERLNQDSALPEREETQRRGKKLPFKLPPAAVLVPPSN